MKAVTRTTYGDSSVLSIREIPIPPIKANEILVKVKATTINRTDCGILTGKPYLIRTFVGLMRPKDLIPGTDFAGVVEAVGIEVKKFAVGDKIWGLHDNGLSSQAEYMVIDQNNPIEKVPNNFSFQQAVASAEGAHYARNFINKVKITQGAKVLVNGATGAIGSAALQMLKALGAEVTAVCAGEHFEIIKKLGADHLIDYRKEDFTQRAEEYSFVFDAVGKSSFGACKPILKKGGTYISSELGPRSENPFLALTTPLFSNKKVRFPFPTGLKESLQYTRDLIDKGLFTPLIDKEVPMAAVHSGYDYVMSGEKIGNVILTFE